MYPRVRNSRGVELWVAYLLDIVVALQAAAAARIKLGRGLASRTLRRRRDRVLVLSTALAGSVCAWGHVIGGWAVRRALPRISSPLPFFFLSAFLLSCGGTHFCKTETLTEVQRHQRVPTEIHRNLALIGKRSEGGYRQRYVDDAGSSRPV